MKRNWICLALAVLLAVSLIPALAEEEAAPSPAGDWYTSIDGIPLRLTLMEDGAYVSEFLGEESDPGQWEEADGFVYLDGDSESTLLFTGDTLVADDTVFTREPVEPLYTPAAPLTEASPFAYEGHWVSEYVEAEGVILPALLVGEHTALWIENEFPLVEGDEANPVFTYGDALVAMGGELFGDTVQRFVFDEETGALILSLEDAHAALTLQLLEDGMVKLTVDTGEESISLYLSHADMDDLADGE